MSIDAPAHKQHFYSSQTTVVPLCPLCGLTALRIRNWTQFSNR